MLNPSTADALEDDPTIRRCIGFARDWGFGGIEVVNLFAMRATDPRELDRANDPVGQDNGRYLHRALLRSTLIVLAWGAHGSLRDRAAATRRVVSRRRPRCLGLTRSGEPRHPLYLRRDAPLVPVRSARRSGA